MIVKRFDVSSVTAVAFWLAQAPLLLLFIGNIDNLHMTYVFVLRFIPPAYLGPLKIQLWRKQCPLLYYFCKSEIWQAGGPGSAMCCIFRQPPM